MSTFCQGRLITIPKAALRINTVSSPNMYTAQNIIGRKITIIGIPGKSIHLSNNNNIIN